MTILISAGIAGEVFCDDLDSLERGVLTIRGVNACVEHGDGDQLASIF
jgi:hypothetical protein